MIEFEKALQDYINEKDINGLNFYAISYDDDYVNSQEIYENELLKQRVLNHTYDISQIYNLLSEGKITASDIIRNTSIDAYDILMDKLKDFDKMVKNNEHKIKSTEIASHDRKIMINSEKDKQSSEKSLYDISKQIIEFLYDAKEILVIKK